MAGLSGTTMPRPAVGCNAPADSTSTTDAAASPSGASASVQLDGHGIDRIEWRRFRGAPDPAGESSPMDDGGGSGNGSHLAPASGSQSPSPQQKASNS